MIGAVKDTTKAIELKTQKTNKAINELEDLMKYATNFDFQFLEPISDVPNSKKTSHFRLRVNVIRKSLFTNIKVTIALHGKSLIFTESNK